MREKIERRRKRRIIIGSIAGIILLLAAVYFGMALYFKSHFFFRTRINGWKVGGMSLEKAEEKVGEGVEDYLLTVFDRKGDRKSVV